MKQINYVEYKHSVAHAIEPKLKALKYHIFVGKKPISYCAKIIYNAINSPEVRFTDKELEIYETFKTINNNLVLYKYANSIVNNAKQIIVNVDDDGELI